MRLNSGRDRGIALVIGANGFLGAPLTNALLSYGYQVRAFDRYSSEPRHCSDNPKVELVRGDFLNRADIRQAVRGVNLVFHFLSLSTPTGSGADPSFDLHANALPSVQLFEMCAREKIDCLYFASSGGTVYGGDTPKRHEEDDALKPISPYGIGKATVENYLRYFRETQDLTSVTFRISNPYGAGQKSSRPQGLIPIALRALRDEHKVTMIGDGTMTRDYIYLDDLIAMIMRVVEQGTQQGTQHRTYNLGSGQATQVREVFECIQSVTAKPLQIQHQPKPRFFVQDSVLNTDRFRREFGSPKLTPLSAGIHSTWRRICDE